MSIASKKRCLDSSLLTEEVRTHFDMGFSSWPCGPDLSDLASTYDFISANANVYGEQLDQYIP